MKSFPLAPPLSGELSARFSPSGTPKANSTAFNSPKNATCLGCIYTASKIAASRPRSTQLRTFSKRSEKIGLISAKRWKKQSKQNNSPKQNASSPNIKAIGNQFVKNFSSRFPRHGAVHLNSISYCFENLTFINHCKILFNKINFTTQLPFGVWRAERESVPFFVLRQFFIKA